MKKFLIHLFALSIILLPSFVALHAQIDEGGCGTGKLCNPLNTGDSLTEFLQAIVEKAVLPIGAIIAVLAFIYTGFLYVVAQGNETKLKTAHRALLYTSVGTALLLGAWTLATVVQNTVHNLTQ